MRLGGQCSDVVSYIAVDDDNATTVTTDDRFQSTQGGSWTCSEWRAVVIACASLVFQPLKKIDVVQSSVRIDHHMSARVFNGSR